MHEAQHTTVTAVTISRFASSLGFADALPAPPSVTSNTSIAQPRRPITDDSAAASRASFRGQPARARQAFLPHGSGRSESLNSMERQILHYERALRRRGLPQDIRYDSTRSETKDVCPEQSAIKSNALDCSNYRRVAREVAVFRRERAVRRDVDRAPLTAV